MKWHVIRRRIQNYWKRRWIRITVSATVLILVIYLQYVISRIPEPQLVEKTEYSPAISKAVQQELIILGPELSPDNVLLKAEGKNHQSIEFRAAQARLTADTVSSIESTYDGQRKVSAGLVEIDYLVARDEKVNDETASTPRPHSADTNSEETASCKTSVTVRTVDGKLPSELRLYQPDKGSQKFQALELTVVGADSEVEIRQAQPYTENGEGNPWASGCKRTLNVGKDSPLVHHGMFILKFVVPANAGFRLDFHALGPTQTLHSAGELFEPALLDLKASTLNVVTRGTNSDPSMRPYRSIEAAGGSRRLDINSLRSSHEELRLSLSGLGRISVNGKAVKTFSLIDLALQYPIAAALFALINTALAGWIVVSIRQVKEHDNR